MPTAYLLYKIKMMTFCEKKSRQIGNNINNNNTTKRSETDNIEKNNYTINHMIKQLGVAHDII